MKRYQSTVCVVLAFPLVSMSLVYATSTKFVIRKVGNNVYRDVDSYRISGKNVVWTGYDGNDTEIYLYNGTTTTQLTDNSWNDLHPQISGTNVAWKGWDGNDYEIYLYDGSTTTQLTNDTSNDEGLQISGTNVAWNDAGSNIHFVQRRPLDDSFASLHGE